MAALQEQFAHSSKSSVSVGSLDDIASVEGKTAVVLVEHRYWGTSTPYEKQTTKALQFHNLDQAVADFVRFARNVKLPFDKNGTSNAPDAVRFISLLWL